MSEAIETDILVIGAGPVGLFTVFEAGLLGLECHLIDNLDKVGGQCIELYPEKPIYDIPGVANQTGKEHIDALLEQIKPFEYTTHLNERVEQIKELKDNFWQVTTNNKKEFITKNVFIAAGAGAFEPRKPPVDNPDKFLGNGVDYSIKDKSIYEDKEIVIFGGGDSALDWSVELAKSAKKILLVHRRDDFRGAEHTEKQMRNLVKEGKIELKIPYVIKSIVGDIKKVKRLKSKPHSIVVKKLGMACSYPGTFNSSIHSIINSTNYKGAILKTIKAGGCNCSRVNFIGAYFAALKGLGTIPKSWIKKTDLAKKILEQK